MSDPVTKLPLRATRGEGRREGRLLTIAIALDNPHLAERVVALLGAVEGVRLVARDDEADVVLADPLGSGSNSGKFESDPDSESSAAAESILTPREREVLALLAEGASNKTIARTLGISVHTAKFHVASLLDKLDAIGRTDAVMHAARLGVIEL